MTNKEFSEKLKAGLKIAERRMIEEKSLTWRRYYCIFRWQDDRAYSCKAASLISNNQGHDGSRPHRAHENVTSLWTENRTYPSICPNL